MTLEQLKLKTLNDNPYLFFTRDDRILKKEFDESYDSMKAWRFGR